GGAPAGAVRQASATAPAPPATPVQAPAAPGPQPPAAPAPQTGTPLPSVAIPGAAGPPAGPNAQPAPPRTLSIQRRTAAPFNFRGQPLPNGENAVIVNGGVILTVRGGEREGLLDIEADRMVVWTRGDTEQLKNQLRAPDGQT